MYIRKDGKVSLNYNDKVVLYEWLTNPTATYKKIAEKIKGSINPIDLIKFKRKQMKKTGLVEKETILLDESYFGLNYKSIVLIKLHDTNNISIFENTMKVLTSVRECRLVKGKYDYMLHTLNKDYADHMEFIKYIQNTDLVSKISTIEVVDEIIKKPQIPIFS